MSNNDVDRSEEFRDYSKKERQVIRVLMAAHVGYPWGGISTFYQDLLGCDVPDFVELRFIDNMDGARIAHLGMKNIANVTRGIRHVWKFIRSLSMFRPNVVHISTAGGSSLFKQSLMVLFARAMNVPVVIAPHFSYRRL